MKHAVYVDDNFHYADEDKRHKLGEYPTRDEAIAAARKVVDDFLERACEPGMSHDALFQSYTSFGTDPFIVPDDPECRFSAWDYARQRCRALCDA